MSNNVITQAGFRAGVAYEWDGVTQETVASAAPFQFGDEFVGAGHTAGVPAAGSPAAGYPWVKKIVGAAPPTVALVANAAGGVMAATLAATSEAEEASLYFNDSLCVDTTRNGEAEWRAALNVIPTGVAQIALGLGSAWVGGPLNLARYLLFVWSAGATPSLYWKDGGSNSGNLAAATGGSAIVTDTNYHVYRVDWSNPADVAFLIDGNRVNALGSIAWAPSGSNGIFQPWHTAYKASGAGLGTLYVDKIDVANRR